MSAGLGVQNRHVEWGAGLPDLDNDGRADVMYVTGHVYPEVERVAAAVPASRSAGRLSQSRRRPVRRRHASRAGGAARPSLEPRRRVRRLRQRRRRRRAGDEHERAAVAAAQRLRGANHWLIDPARRYALRTGRRSARSSSCAPAAGRQARAVVSQSSYYSHDDLRLHFGLGAAATAERDRDSLAERRDAGAEQRAGPRQVLTIVEPSPRGMTTRLEPRFSRSRRG